MSVIIKSNPPECSEANFEKLLSTDELFLDCFNRFLSLETFPKQIKFNCNNYTFELISPHRDELISQIRSQVLSEHQGKPVNTDEDIKVNYNVKILLGSQTVTWVKVNRLGYFLQSKYYMNYRLGRLLSQITPNTDLSQIIMDYVTPMLQEAVEERESAFSPFLVSLSEEATLEQSRRTSENGMSEEEIRNISFLTFNPLTNDKLRGDFSTQSPVDPRTKFSVNESDGSLIFDEEVEKTQETQPIGDYKSQGSPVLQVKQGKKQVHNEDPFEDVDEIVYKQTTLKKEKLTTTINSIESLEKFEEFLKANNAGKFSSFWREIDRLKLIHDQIKFPNSIQDIFTRPTSSNAINPRHLEEINTPANWNRETILKLQNKIIEPLLMYWMPMFLRRDKLIRTDHVGELHRNIMEIENELAKPFKVYFDAQEHASVDLKRGKSEEILDKVKRCMKLEKLAGYVLYEHVLNKKDETLKNCYKIWNLIEDYKYLFDLEPFDVNLVEKYSKYIYATCLHSDSQHYFGFPYEKARVIYSNLGRHTKNLFNKVESFVLEKLMPVHVEYCDLDKSRLKKVPQKTISVKLETKSRAVNEFVSRGRVKKEILFPFEPMKNYVEPVFHPEIKAGTLKKSKVTIHSILSDGVEIERLKEFLRENGALIDLECWVDIEAFKRLSHVDKASCDIKLIEIKGRYLNNKYFFGENSPASEKEQNKAMSLCGGWSKLLNDIPPPKIVSIMQTHVANRLNSKWIPAFLQNLTEEPVSAVVVEKTEEKMKKEEIEDLTEKMGKKSITPELKPEPSAVEILDFRASMKDPSTYERFRVYLRSKGSNCETNLMFWEEVQKYKQLFLSKCDDSLKRTKVTSIINCFLNSHVPPQIQVAVGKSAVEKIIDTTADLNPYLFREAHFSVFRWLLTVWAEFGEFRKNTASPKIKEVDGETVEEVKKVVTKQTGKTTQGNKMEWSYSNYLEALDVEVMVEERRDKIKKKHN